MGGKVLLVDNNLNTQRMVELTLTTEFLEVTSLGDGNQALRTAEKDRFDIVIADADVPGKDGFDFCRACRETPALADLPFILIFHSAEAVDRVRLKGAGVNDFLVKPFKSKDLVDKVLALLAAAKPEAPTLAAPQGEPPHAPARQAPHTPLPQPASSQAPGPEASKKTSKMKKGEPRKKTEQLMDLTGRRPRIVDTGDDEEGAEEEAPVKEEPPRAQPAAPPAARAARPEAAPEPEPAGSFGFDLAGALAEDQSLQESLKPKQEPLPDIEAEQTVFMTRQDLASLSQRGKPGGQPARPPEPEEGGFTMIMSKDETKAIRPEPRRQPPPPPKAAVHPEAPDAEPAPEDEEAGFHTMIMAKDEFESLRAKAAAKPKRRTGPLPRMQTPLPRAEKAVPSRPDSAVPPRLQEEPMDLGAADEVSATDETIAVRPSSFADGARGRAMPTGDDPAVERIVREASEATEEELERVLARLGADRAADVKRVSGELILKLARRIVPEIAERLVKEEIERLKKQVV